MELKFKLKFVLLLICLGYVQTPHNLNVNAFESLPNNFELTYYVKPFFDGDEQRFSIAKFIQSSLLPLGIKVNIELKSSGGFIWGDHGEKTYDLTNLRWGGKVILPLFEDYLINSNGCYYWPICENNFQVDYGVNQTKVEQLFNDLAQESNITKHKELTNEFVEIFYDTMLYELPLVTVNGWGISWSYLSDYSDEKILKATRMLPGGYQGLLVDIFNGYNISDPDNIRLSDSDDETLNVDASSEANYNTGDPLQFENNRHHIYFIASTLAFYDVLDFTLRPNIAKAWEVTDWELDDGRIIPNGVHKFWINENVAWKRNFDKLNEVSSYGSQNVSAKDFAFTLQVNNLTNTTSNQDSLYSDLIDDFEINETENSLTLYLDDPKRDDIRDLSELFPTPAFLLNQTLTYNESISGNISELDALGYSVFDTLEWDDYESNPYTTGPFYMKEYVQSDHLTISARDDYWFPNEWDNPDGKFALHKQKQVSPIFFTYNATDENPQRKPAELFIKNINFIQIYDKFPFEDLDDTYRFALESGIIDEVFVGYLQDYQIIEDHINDDRFKVQKFDFSVGPESLWFDLNNPHLKKINVRKAIAHAIDREALLGTLSNYYTAHNSLVWKIHEGWYDDNHGLPYDYTIARDLMRDEGYKALENPVQSFEYATIPPITIRVPDDELWSQSWIIMIIFAVYASANLSNRKRRKYKE